MPLARKQRDAKLRLAVIDADRCKPSKCGHECEKICPKNRAGARCVTVSAKIADIEEEHCIGCGACVKVCPFDAIKIINLPQELDGQTTHGYGHNGFRLHRMPVPKPGHVLGLLGSNGTGKSTILNILGHRFTPNLGQYDNPPDADAIVRYFRGSTLQGFFKNLYAGQARVASKPQSIDLITTRYSKSAKTLGQYLDDRSQIGAEATQRLLEQLDLTHLRDRKIADLSGGELQRFAIASIAARNADVYLIDEPSAYLDIRQRLQAARAIEELKGEYRILVEHDLALLDYISDHISLIWGEPAAYGVVSHPAATADAINNFLDGMIPSENMRFREPLSFKITNEDLEIEGSFALTGYPDFRVNLGNQFELRVQGGDICTSEIVVLLGENGMGKTTLIRALAGDRSVETVPPVNLELAVSHKPQIVNASRDCNVKTLLESKIGANFYHAQFQSDVVKPLGVDRLTDMQLRDLSGGERQRVAIVLCLGKPADIYLLDEPSAFLDCEYRVAAARAIKRFIMSTKKTAFVVEHDFMMASYLADRVIVYEGQPGISATALSPSRAKLGINRFLSRLDVTFRRDPKTDRPRINKRGSVKDREQKSAGQYY